MFLTSKPPNAPSHSLLSLLALYQHTSSRYPTAWFRRDESIKSGQVKISNDRPVSRLVLEKPKHTPAYAFKASSISLTQGLDGAAEAPVAETRKRPSWQPVRSG